MTKWERRKVILIKWSECQVNLIQICSFFRSSLHFNYYAFNEEPSHMLLSIVWYVVYIYDKAASQQLVKLNTENKNVCWHANLQCKEGCWNYLIISYILCIYINTEWMKQHMNFKALNNDSLEWMIRNAASCFQHNTVIN